MGEIAENPGQGIGAGANDGAVQLIVGRVCWPIEQRISELANVVVGLDVNVGSVSVVQRK